MACQDDAANEFSNRLAIGTRLRDFEIRNVLGEGGFGIVYLAYDLALECEVAIKEYMPAQLAGRARSMHVSVRSKSDSELFEVGLRSFINEAKLLAKFKHRSLVAVRHLFEDNGTAYMELQLVRGRTLKQLRQSLGQAPAEDWLRGRLMPLLEALELLHDNDVYHRDIAPDNIIVEPPDEHLVLLDFGAARQVINDKTRALTKFVKPGYAPIEQQADVGAKQGPWTDLYALGATLHFVLTGHPPPEATSRALAANPPPLSALASANVSAAFLAVVD